MKQISLEESKKIQCDILKNIDTFCRKNGINYSLCYGTLIGAIRHKGFIPWDDDIDIMMPRKDYDLFINKYKDEYYNLLSHHTNKNWPFLYSSIEDPNTITYYGEHKSVRGVWVTIIPVENIRNENISKMVSFLNFYEKKIIRLKHSYWTPNTNILYNLAKAICRLLLLPVPCSSFIKYVENKLKYNQSTGVLGCPSVWMIDNRIITYQENIFSSFIDVEFEGMKCMSLSGYHEYLQIEYGDYMTPPPIEEQVPKHGFTAYWK